MKIFDLINNSYSDFVTRVTSYLQSSLPGYKGGISNSTIFGQLINVVNAAVQNALIYLQDAFAEQNKYTAQRKKSVYGLAAMTGFQPSLGYAAGVNFMMTYIPNNVNDLTYLLKNKTRVQSSQNGLIYNIILPQDAVVFSTKKDMSSKLLYAVEGTFETQSFVSDGGQLYTINVSFNGDCDISYTEVYVNDELWERCESLYDMDPDGKQYCISTSLTKGFDIVFGNDDYGRALSNEDQIRVTYLLHNGEAGNIDKNIKSSLVFVDSLEDAAGNPIDADSVFNIAIADMPANNGTASDTTAFVREMIGYNSRAMVLADEKNYKLFLSRFSFVGYNKTWSEEGSLVINSMIMKNYKSMMKTGNEYFDLHADDFILTDAQKQSIQNAIKASGQQLAGTVLNIFDPEIIKYAMYVYIKMNDMSYDKTYIQDKIRNAVGQFMGDIHNDTIIAKSDMIHLIKQAVEGIDSVDVYFLSEKNEKAIIDGGWTECNYVYNPKTKLFDTEIKSYGIDPANPDPGLGLDSHGNICVKSVYQFPVLMGGWQFISSDKNLAKQYTTIADPLIIVFE